MSGRLSPGEFIMPLDIRDHDSAIELANLWRRQWRVAFVVLAVIFGLAVLLTSVLHAYSRSHCEYLTSAPSFSRQAGLS
jgi:hypothetical protein